MRSKIKICGIRHLAEVHFINRLAVDYVGFVFAPGKRQVDEGQARLLATALRPGVLMVGVFTEMPLGRICAIREACGLDIVQLHGAYEDDAIASLQGQVWKAIPMCSPESLDRLKHYPSASAFVLDACVSGMAGGTGRSFNWDWAQNASERHTIVLAGGLTSHNVKQAILKVSPHIVDVSSGVEDAFGKNEKSVSEFVKAVQEDEP